MSNFDKVFEVIDNIVNTNVAKNISFIEKKIRTHWKSCDIYNLIKNKNQYNEKKNFIDGPPFVSADTLHYGHLLISFIKSTILNFLHMQGFSVIDIRGHDCHGLPIEMVANKLIKNDGVLLETRKNVIDYGMDKYIDKCANIVKEFSTAWTMSTDINESIFDMMARFYDLNDQYKTCNMDYMNAVIKTFKKLCESDLGNLVYVGYKVMPYSYACATVISNFEADNYKNVNTNSALVKFKIDNENNEYFLVWTTTPWTLPCNIALCVNAEKDYIKIEYNGEKIILMKEQMKFISDKKDNSENSFDNAKIIETFKGEKLVGLKYLPLYNFYDYPTFFTVVSDDWVNESGTGIVHLSPGFGQNDLDTCVKMKIITIDNIGNLELCPITDNGLYTSKICDYQGTLVFDANKLILNDLKKSGALVKIMPISHSYPFCPRTDKMLIYKATESIFIHIEPIKQRMLELCDQVKWHPESVYKKFRLWLAGAMDWCVSRNRYWGCPILMYVNDVTHRIKVIGSIEELQQYATFEITDLHYDTDKIIILDEDDNNRPMRRIGPFVFDCWFESGSAIQYFSNLQLSNASNVDKCITAEFIAEGIDQCRGWFYTLMVIQAALSSEVPYKNVICAGVLLNDSGEKFSKRLANYNNPIEVIKKCGSDATRLYLINSPCARGYDFKFKTSDIDTVGKKCSQYTEALKFFCVSLRLFLKDYPNVNSNDILNSNNYNFANIMDFWMINRVNILLHQITSNLERYDLQLYTPFENFVDDMNNSYVRIIRSRAKNGTKQDRQCVLTVLFDVLHKSSIILAPFLPHIAEYMYQSLFDISDSLCDINLLTSTSVHLCDYPKITELNHNVQWIPMMLNTLDIINKLRDANGLNLKRPLLSVTIYHDGPIPFDDINVLQEQTNIIEIYFKPITPEIATYIVVPNAKTLGKDFGKMASSIKTALINCDVVALIENGYFRFNDEIILDNKYYQIEMKLAVSKNSNTTAIDNKYNIIVEIDTNENEIIKQKLQLRLFINSVQKFRKLLNIQEWDEIKIYFVTNDDLTKLIINNMNIIKQKIIYPISTVLPEVLPKHKHTVKIIDNDLILYIDIVNQN